MIADSTYRKSVRSWRLRTGIAGGRGSVVCFRRRAEDFREDGFQAVGPDLVTLQSRVQLVLRHVLEKLPVFVGEFVVYVEETNLLSIRHLRQAVVDAVDRRNYRHV